MLLEKFISTEATEFGFNDMTASILRMHDIEFLGSEMIGAPTDPDASNLFLRVDQSQVRLHLSRKEDGSWGNYLWDQARLVTADRKEIKGAAGNVPAGVIKALQAFFQQSSPSSGAQPQPN